jgi:PTH1 family peptidyl-tRNA hydrolase
MAGGDGIELVVGLGNPGFQYQGTRHNLGFMVLDTRAQRLGLRFRRDGAAEVVRHDGVYYLKPLTFMNVSGDAVGPFCRRYQIAPPHVLVVVDDMDLPARTLRIRPGGSSGGHNGLKSVARALGTELFPRLRIGVGRPPDFMPAADWVLRPLPRTERVLWRQCLERADEAIDAVLREGLEAAMSRYNAREGA